MNKNYNNFFCLIGKCLNVNSELMVLLVDSDIFNLYFSDAIDINCIEENKLTKVEGFIDVTNIIPRLIINNVYQIKDKYVM